MKIEWEKGLSYRADVAHADIGERIHIDVWTRRGGYRMKIYYATFAFPVHIYEFGPMSHEEALEEAGIEFGHFRNRILDDFK